jgi:hypothetical protein
MKQLVEAQRLLERQRYSFPDNWISMDTIQNSWTSMNDVLKRKEQVIETKVRQFFFKNLFQIIFLVGYNSRKS